MKRASDFESSHNNEPEFFEPSYKIKPDFVPIPQILPTLPPIKDRTILSSVLTHQGTLRSFQNHSQNASYERYEFLGDGYLEIIARELLFSRFTEFPVGQLNKLKEELVRNKTLARFTVRYEIDKMARLPSGWLSDAGREKIHGDLFEAYLAGVILSDSKNGMEVARTWLKALWEPFLQGAETLSKAAQATVQNTIVQAREQKARAHAKEQGAKSQAKGQDTKALAKVQNAKEQARVQNTEAPAEVSITDDVQAEAQNAEAETQVNKESSKDARELLSTRLGGKGVRIDYKDERNPQRISPSEVKYFIAVYLTGWGRDDQLLGTGKGLNKREASKNAAVSALSNHALVDDIADIKQKHDEKVKKEREAKAAQNGRTYEEQIRFERKATADRKVQAKAEAIQQRIELANLNAGSNEGNGQTPRGHNDKEPEAKQPSRKRQRTSHTSSSDRSVDEVQLPWMQG
ncbi:MAG: hypothetical protein Q9160_006796 [Pyrenula sp. 1 TL-2023]